VIREAEPGLSGSLLCLWVFASPSAQKFRLSGVFLEFAGKNRPTGGFGSLMRETRQTPGQGENNGER
jgi:hypothetical protein